MALSMSAGAQGDKVLAAESQPAPCLRRPMKEWSGVWTPLPDWRRGVCTLQEAKQGDKDGKPGALGDEEDDGGGEKTNMHTRWSGRGRGGWLSFSPCS